MVGWLKPATGRVRGRHARRRVTWWQHVSEMVWPSMGARAFGRWLLLKLLRAADDPHRVALGFAFGVWVSFTPWLGLHLALAWSLCWLAGGSYLAALMGSWVGNPWTYALMWWGGLQIGRAMLDIQAVADERVMDGLTLGALWERFDQLFYDVLWPMSVGGVILGAVVGSLFYALIYVLVQHYYDAKRVRLLERKLERELKVGLAKMRQAE
jgi:uncharacterized protein